MGMLNCFPESLQGYYNALERTFFLDHVDDASLRYWEVNCAVHRRGLELIKPGVKCSDIADELNEMLLDMVTVSVSFLIIMEGNLVLSCVRMWTQSSSRG